MSRMNLAPQAQELLHRYGRICSIAQSRSLLNKLMNNIQWQTGFEAYGRHFEIPRQQAWYADRGIQYRYADKQMPRQDWIDPLRAIKQQVEDRCDERFNSVLVTLYRNGEDYVGWHADDEKELGERSVIASLSLGASREFHYRHKQAGGSRVIDLNDGELLVMQAGFQEGWEHSVPRQPEVKRVRINLTFRRVLECYDMDKAREIMARAYKD